MKRLLFNVIEILLTPLIIISAYWMKVLTIAGHQKTILAEKIFMKIGILPVRDHYYQPLINPLKHLTKSLNSDRNLPAIDFNTTRQIEILRSFNFMDELLEFPLEKVDNGDTSYYYNNGSFEAGDSEYLYSVIRKFKPRKIIEIGSGLSTLISLEALKKNKLGDENYTFSHICVEPYELPWLEKTGATIIREKAESLPMDFYNSLGENDILFIDSSHIIRPQGDVLYEYLEILPELNKGVLIHIHDIFTPKDYPESWVIDEHRLWNEQYLLEAFLSYNSNFEIVGALNYLMHHHRDLLEEKCPILKNQKERYPGSFWMRKTV